jgi:hypothetical protein
MPFVNLQLRMSEYQSNLLASQTSGMQKLLAAVGGRVFEAVFASTVQDRSTAASLQVKLYQCLTKHHDMKTWGGRFTPGTHLLGGVLGPRAVAKRKRSRRESNPCRPARSLVIVLTELPRFSGVKIPEKRVTR